MLGSAELPITIIAWGYIATFIGRVIKNLINSALEAKEEAKQEIAERESKKRVQFFVDKTLGDK